MTVNDIAQKLNLTILSGNTGMEREVKGGYVSDLLSDVMGYSREGQVWITLQSHKNVMAIASLKDLAAVILVKGIKPSADTVQQSNEENIPILGTELETYDIAGLLYTHLNDEGLHG
jgi:predicted transcriptional regulator